jgi:hypothetical protein
MSDDYRKPAKADTPRGKLVRRAEPPPGGTSDDPGYRALLAEYAEDVRAERDRSRRSAAIGIRVLGGIMTLIAIIVILTYREELGTTGRILASTRGAAVLGLCSTLGPWLLVFGNGGAAAMHETPLWYRWGARLLALFGMTAMVSGAALPLIVALLDLTI